MTTQALMRRDDFALSVTFTDAAIALKTQALEAAALIGRVHNAVSQQEAVNAQAAISNSLNLVEKARKACKEPVLEFGRRIDAAAKEFVRDLKTEQVRIATLIGNFQTLEQARVRALQQAENERLLAIEREKAKELAQANTHEEAEAIQARFAERAAVEGPQQPIGPIKAQGQRVRQEWNIAVTDIWLLAKSHPTCVKITPMLSEIKSLLDAGVKVNGVKAEREIRSGVTTSRQPQTIDV